MKHLSLSTRDGKQVLSNGTWKNIAWEKLILRSMSMYVLVIEPFKLVHKAEDSETSPD